MIETDFVTERAILAQNDRDESRVASMDETARNAAETWAVETSRLAFLGDASKRLLDVTIAGALLLLLLPFFAIITLLVWLDAPGPVFFRAERVGYRGRKLRMLKFRKMKHDVTGLPLTVGQDLRFTRIGAWLAKTKLDELPQLWQVLRGEMSLVGPRPEDEDFIRRHAKDYEAILSVRPGMTGLSQLAFARESEILDDLDPLEHYHQAILPQKVRLDRMYARQRSLWLDLRILFWTTTVVLLRRHVAVHRQTAKMGLRRRRPVAVVEPSTTMVLETRSTAAIADTTSATVLVETSASNQTR